MLNLAIADIVNLSGVLLVATILFVLNDKSSHSQEPFEIILVPQNVANFTLAFIALERYNALVRTMNPFLVLLSMKNVKRILVLFWCGALILRVPVPTVEMVVPKIPLAATIYNKLSFICTYVLSLLVITVCYSKILKGVFYDRTILGKNVTNEAELLENKRLALVMVIVTVVFWLNNLPVLIMKILALAQYESFSKKTTHRIQATMVIIGCVSSTINPYIYGLQSEKYRRQVKELFGHKETNTARIESNQYQATHL